MKSSLLFGDGFPWPCIENLPSSGHTSSFVAPFSIVESFLSLERFNQGTVFTDGGGSAATLCISSGAT